MKQHLSRRWEAPLPPEGPALSALGRGTLQNPRDARRELEKRLLRECIIRGSCEARVQRLPPIATHRSAPSAQIG